jgi:hypothetical protein
LYEEVLRANAARNTDVISGAVEGAFKVLVPIAVAAHTWNLQDAPMLVRGLALVERVNPSEELSP